MMSEPLIDFRALVHRGFRPVPWEFGERWCQFAQLGLVPMTPMDLGRVKQRLIVHRRMLAHTPMRAALLNRLSPGKRQ